MMPDDIITRDSQGNLAVNTVSSTEASVPYNYDDCFTVDTNGRRALRVVGGSGGSVDTSKLLNVDTLPTASATNVGKFYLYNGATDANYTHGYIYECVSTPVYDSTVEFNPASISGTTAACSGSDFATLVAEYGTGAIDTIIKGTLTYDESGELLVFVGQDDTDTTVCTFQLYVQDYIDAGFTFTGTLEDGDVIAFSCTIEETGAVYAWERVDTQPNAVNSVNSKTGAVVLTASDVNAQEPLVSGTNIKTINGSSVLGSGDLTIGGLPSQTGNSGKFLTTNGTDASWSDKALINKTTANFSLVIAGNDSSSTSSVAIGNFSSVAGSTTSGTTVGTSSHAGGFGCGFGASADSGMYGTAIGYEAKSNRASVVAGTWTIAIGYQAKSYGDNSIQLGQGTNSDANTFKVANGNGNFELMSADGTIPAARHASLPAADGTYVLKLVIANGVPTLTWVAE